jgi:DNA-binding MarR family transcriptional regulator
MKQNTIYAGVRLRQERGERSFNSNERRGGVRCPEFSASEFSIMKRLAASPGSELVQLKGALEGTGRSLPGNLDRLQRRYIVDCVTFLEGERVKRVYSLTQEGRESFLQLLASFYEIPE